MPIKDTPWGEMKQTKAGCDEDGTRRPPKPGFLPPAPPPCSLSPIPSRFQALASISKDVSNFSPPEKCDSAVYDSVKEKEVPNNQNNTFTNEMSNNNTASRSNGYEQTNNTNLNSTNGESTRSYQTNGTNEIDNTENGSIKLGSQNEESEEEVEEEESSYEYYDTSSEEEGEEEGEEDQASDEPEKELDKVLDQSEKQQEALSGTDEYEEEDDDEWEYEDEDEEYEDEEEEEADVLEEVHENEEEEEKEEERESIEEYVKEDNSVSMKENDKQFVSIAEEAAESPDLEQNNLSQKDNGDINTDSCKMKEANESLQSSAEAPEKTSYTHFLCIQFHASSFLFLSSIVQSNTTLFFALMRHVNFFYVEEKCQYHGELQLYFFVLIAYNLNFHMNKSLSFLNLFGMLS